MLESPIPNELNSPLESINVVTRKTYKFYEPNAKVMKIDIDFYGNKLSFKLRNSRDTKIVFVFFNDLSFFF